MPKGAQAKVLVTWRSLDPVASFGSCSEPAALAEASVRKFSSGTLEAYLSNCSAFIDLLERSEVALSDMSVAFFADFLYSCESFEEEDGNRSREMLKALSWLSRVAQIKHLEGLWGTHYLAFAGLASWERKILEPFCPTQLCLLLAVGLLLAWRICQSPFRKVRLAFCWPPVISRADLHTSKPFNAPPAQLLLQSAYSGHVSAALLAPPCKEYSRLNKKPGRPKPLCTPCQGCPASLPSKSTCHRQQRNPRLREQIFRGVAGSGGASFWQQPPSRTAIWPGVMPARTASPDQMLRHRGDHPRRRAAGRLLPWLLPSQLRW